MSMRPMTQPSVPAAPAPDTDLHDQVAALTAQVQALLAQQTTSGGVSPQMLQELLTNVTQAQALAYERAANPSNKSHPGISVFSYPEGDVANPRPPFKCRMFWVGYELDYDTTEAEHIELLNQIAPGSYTFRRTDGSTDTLVVKGQFDALGGLGRLLFEFEVKERRNTLPSAIAMLRDALGLLSPQEAELADLRQKLEAARTTGLVSA